MATSPACRAHRRPTHPRNANFSLRPHRPRAQSPLLTCSDGGARRRQRQQLTDIPRQLLPRQRLGHAGAAQRLPNPSRNPSPPLRLLGGQRRRRRPRRRQRAAAAAAASKPAGLCRAARPRQPRQRKQRRRPASAAVAPPVVPVVGRVREVRVVVVVVAVGRGGRVASWRRRRRRRLRGVPAAAAAVVEVVAAAEGPAVGVAVQGEGGGRGAAAAAAAVVVAAAVLPVRDRWVPAETKEGRRGGCVEARSGAEVAPPCRPCYSLFSRLPGLTGRALCRAAAPRAPSPCRAPSPGPSARAPSKQSKTACSRSLVPVVVFGEQGGEQCALNAQPCQRT